ncbi:hypothetical protein MMC16_006885 [Acarospora aff. strigata]|nr:hypothetical protein [Acarospora aff. strigata]
MLITAVGLLWLYFLKAAFAAPSTDSARTAIQHLQKRAAVCFGPERPETQEINPLDCVRAVLDMPTTQTRVATESDAVTGPFSNGEPEGSPFKLPRHFSNGNCMIGVSMAATNSRGREASSWNEIAAKANGIIGTCVLRPFFSRRGGTDQAGANNQINVEIFMSLKHLDFLVGHNDFTTPRPPPWQGLRMRPPVEKRK